MRPAYFSKQVVELEALSHLEGITDFIWNDTCLNNLLIVFFEDCCLLGSDSFSVLGDEIFEMGDTVKGDQIFQLANFYQQLAIILPLQSVLLSELSNLSIEHTHLFL